MYEEAAQSYAKLLSMHPKHANANLNLAVCLERLGRWQEAADFFEKAAEAQPDRLDARLGLGIALLHLEKSDAAAENFRQVLEQQPITPPRYSEKPSRCSCSGTSMRRRGSTSPSWPANPTSKSASSTWSPLAWPAKTRP